MNVNFRKTKNVLFLCGGLLAGYILANRVSKTSTQTDSLRVYEHRDNYYISSKISGATHVIEEKKDEVFIGGLEHMVKSAYVLSDKRGFYGED